MSSLLSLQFWWTDLSLPEVGSWLCGVREYSLRSWWFWLRGQTRWGRDLGQDQSRCETCEGIFNTNSGFYTLVCMLCLFIYLYYKVAQSLFLDQLHASVYLFYFYHKYGAWENREFVPNLSHSLCSLISSHRKKNRHTKGRNWLSLASCSLIWYTACSVSPGVCRGYLSLPLISGRNLRSSRWEEDYQQDKRMNWELLKLTVVVANPIWLVSLLHLIIILGL